MPSPTFEALRREDALHARTAGFRNRVAAAGDWIAEALGTIERPYVAFSGGKDSLVMLALVRQQRPAVAVVWSDDEFIEPETPGYVTDLAAAWDLDLTIVSGYARHAGWFDPWRMPGERWREPLPAMLPVRCRTEEWAIAAGHDGAFVGLRAQERAKRLANAKARGPLYLMREGWRCQPLAWWTLADIWAAIAEWGLPYSPVYDRLAASGVPRDLQRVGPLPLAPGWVFRSAWPDLHRRAIARYGDHWGG